MNNDASSEEKAKKLIEFAIRAYEKFEDKRATSSQLDVRSVVHAISDSQSDLKRAGDYHSDSGADELREAAYTIRWMAIHRPICTLGSFPKNKWNVDASVTARVNASYCLYLLDILVRDKLVIERELARDLYYCFQFRYRMEPESIYLLLKHAAL